MLDSDFQTLWTLTPIHFCTRSIRSSRFTLLPPLAVAAFLLRAFQTAAPRVESLGASPSHSDSRLHTIFGVVWPRGLDLSQTRTLTALCARHHGRTGSLPAGEAFGTDSLSSAQSLTQRLQSGCIARRGKSQGHQFSIGRPAQHPVGFVLNLRPVHGQRGVAHAVKNPQLVPLATCMYHQVGGPGSGVERVQV